VIKEIAETQLRSDAADGKRLVIDANCIALTRLACTYLLVVADRRKMINLDRTVIDESSTSCFRSKTRSEIVGRLCTTSPKPAREEYVFAPERHVATLEDVDVPWSACSDMVVADVAPPSRYGSNYAAKFVPCALGGNYYVTAANSADIWVRIRVAKPFDPIGSRNGIVVEKGNHVASSERRSCL